MENLSLEEKKVATDSNYEHCLRRCKSCHAAYSNAQNNPTLLFKEPLHNIPTEVRDSLNTVLDKALNMTNRKSKKNKIGFNTSEDALSWTVFRWAQLNNKLSAIIKNIAQQSASGIPAYKKLVYWKHINWAK